MSRYCIFILSPNSQERLIQQGELTMKGKKLLRWVGLYSLTILCSVIVAQASAVEPPVIDLKFANYYPQPAQQSKICEEFIKEFENRTKGRVKVRYFAGGSLLKGSTMIKGIESGIADIGLAHIQYTAGRMPVSEACDLPHGFPSVWVSSHVVNDFYNKYKPKEWGKVKPLWLFTNSPSILITDKPVKAIEDLKGLTIRAPGPLGEVVRALGGTPAPTPIVETYDAIAKGVVNGAFVSPEAVKTFRFAEVAKNLTMSWNVGSSYTFYVVMNKKKYDALPGEIKEILDQLSGEYKERMPLMWNAIDFAGLDFAGKMGVKVTNFSEQEADKWMTRALPIIDTYVKKMTDKGYSEPEVKEWLSFINDRNEYWSAKQVKLKILTATGTEDMRP